MYWRRVAITNTLNNLQHSAGPSCSWTCSSWHHHQQHEHKQGNTRIILTRRLSTSHHHHHRLHLSEGVRVRYAPSPTGFMHLGGLRTALYNYLLAKKENGRFILRIEDTDQTRFVPGATEDIIKTMRWAGLDIHEGPGFGGEYGPYIQSERTKIYQHHANLLLASGHAYKCFCKGERLADLRGRQLSYDRACLRLSAADIHRLEQSKEPYTVRLKVPRDDDSGADNILVQDIIHGDTSFSMSSVDDQILLKSDGYPTYHLACVVDDHLMKISHVIRGEEWLSSTPKHILLYRAFGWTAPLFAHLPLLLNVDKTKLSKRHGHASVESYIRKGYLPSAVVNFVALLGWTPPMSTPPTADDELFYSLQALTDKFSLSSVVLGGCVVNVDKLYWVSTQHIQKTISSPSAGELMDTLRPVINAAVLKHIEQPFYSDPNSLYFLRSDPTPPSTPPTVTTKTPTSTPSTPSSTPTSSSFSKVVEDLPAGIAPSSVRLSAAMVSHHPLLPLLLDGEYLRSVVLTVRERMHVVGDIAALAIPFFVEPSFATGDAREMRKKFWNPTVHTQMRGLYHTLKELSSDQWNDKSISEAVRQFSKRKPADKKEQGVGGGGGGSGGGPGGLGGLFNGLRLLVLGSSVGAGVPQSFATLGRATVLRRLARALDIDVDVDVDVVGADVDYGECTLKMKE